ncbi:MAG TPA: L,D-transpeptidase [Xanthobacteraceae bacterium]
MVFRTAGAVATLLIGLGASGQALAQFFPPPQAYPPPQPYPSGQAYPAYRVAPPVAEADNAAPINDAQVESRPLPPPAAMAPQATEPLPPAGVQYGRPAAAEETALPPTGGYREVPPGYRDGYQQSYFREAPLPGPQGYEPAAAGSRPYYGAPMPPAPVEEAARPPLPIGPGQIDPRAPGSTQGDPHAMAALPPDVRPETGPKKALPPRFQRTLVDYVTKEPAGTIIVDTPNTYLYLVLGHGKALRYGIGVGREGFTWTGTERVTRMAEWPDWHPPEEMIDRQPYLPRFMAGGETNPLGARALYLGKTVYRIHGTNQPSTIGTFVSSGCIRLTNDDVMDLYTRVKVGTRVVVLPGKPPAPTASAAPPPGATTAPTSEASAAPPPSPPAPLPPAGGGAQFMPPAFVPPPSAMAR